MKDGAAYRREEGPADGELIGRMRGGDEAAKVALVKRHTPLLFALAKRLGGDAAQREEMRQAGYIGLLLAARQFDPGQGAKFVTYAVPWILGEMRRARAGMADAMGARERRRRIAACEAAFRRREGRSPRVDELARLCGMSAHDAMAALCAEPISLEAARGDGQRIGATLAGTERIDVETLDLRRAMALLPQEERQLLYLRYFRDRTQTEAAAMMGKSQTQISRIERRALDRLHAMLA